MFEFGVVLIIVGVGCAIPFFICADDMIFRIVSLFCVLIAMIGFVICIFSYEPPLCPGCHTDVSTCVRFCEACGYELIPYCDGCGEFCETAFCHLCGAEQ